MKNYTIQSYNTSNANGRTTGLVVKLTDANTGDLVTTKTFDFAKNPKLLGQINVCALAGVSKDQVSSVTFGK